MKRLKKEVLIKNKKLNNNNPKIWAETIETWVVDDFYATVICPNCKVGVLNMKDEPTKQSNVISRYVHCDNCGITETFTMPTPDYDKFSN